MFFTAPEDAGWNAERRAVGFGVEISEYPWVGGLPRHRLAPTVRASGALAAIRVSVFHPHRRHPLPLDCTTVGLPLPAQLLPSLTEISSAIAAAARAVGEPTGRLPAGRFPPGSTPAAAI
jgi:hypothetical protein